MRLKVLASVLFSVFDQFLYKLNLIEVYEKIDKERGTLCSNRDADDWLNNIPAELGNMLSIRNST